MARSDRHIEGIGQAQRTARDRRLAGADLRQHRVLVQQALDQHFDLAAAGLVAEEARLDHAGVVEDQQVAGAQVVDQVGELAVIEMRVLRVVACGQQAARGAVGQGGLRDQLGRQIEIEIGQRQHEWRRRHELRQMMAAGAGTIIGDPQSPTL